MSPLFRRTAVLGVLALIALLPATRAQFQGEPEPVLPVPPPAPPEPPPEEAGDYDPIVEASEEPWGLDPQLLKRLHEKAEAYEEYARRFTCNETARLATYNARGEVGNETTRRYGYVLVQDPATNRVRELRQAFAKDGTLKPGEVEDEEPFPPAYAWVFLFSGYHEPYFAYRHVEERFDGFDYVHEIEFRGSWPFTDGRDIRQWEGRVLVDAFTYTPLEILAEPAHQRDRIEALYRNYAKSFKIAGFSTGKKPLAYEARIQFRYRRDGLTFPTDLRYDTAKAVSPRELLPVRASTRTYDNYLFTETRTRPTVGDALEP